MYIDGEKFFEPVLKSFGFMRVDEDLGKNPDFENADFINKASRVILEVKTIEKEYMPNGGFIQEINTILAKPVIINPNGTGQYSIEFDTSKNPKNIIYEPIRRTLRKANNQIEATKEYYFNNNMSPDPIGLVLLVIHGLVMVPPMAVASLVRHCLDNGLSNIDGVCICNPYFISRNPFTCKDNDREISVVRMNDNDKASICAQFGDIIDAAIKLYFNEPQYIIK